MTPTERRATFSLASIYFLRMLGFFLILPVFAIYAADLEGVTPLLIGLAIGAYGLTQALLQIPFGMLSDRIGRKPVIVGGLIIFAVGSVVAALADSIYGVVAGRALQGSGAIAAAVMALAADLTREEQRTKIMAVIGMSIGASFILALILGSVFNDWIGVSGIFWLTAVLAIVGIGIAMFLVPQPKDCRRHRDAEPVAGQFARVLADTNLLRLDYGILTLHVTITSIFLVMPLVLRDSLGIEVSAHWHVYLPVLLISVAAMVPFVILAEKRRRMKEVFLGAIAMMVMAQLGFYYLHNSLIGLVVAMIAFFTAFNLLEAVLPSMISKVAPAESKGTAMGIYSSSQFTGSFIGGVFGGWIHGVFGLSGVFLFGAAAAVLWLLVASGMAQPGNLTNKLIHVGAMGEEESDSLVSRLRAVPGVVDAVIISEEGAAYLKVDLEKLAPDALDEFSTLEV
ncbi:Inner membrane transport protein YajR [hydrothermal vent metagenome]|uniref:Inner membrane transport protein YajR n=1 Tax=hydrothermal vent metagenome TaxID=652676 RepID=A0A3B1AW11_9ZZZZ